MTLATHVTRCHNAPVTLITDEDGGEAICPICQKQVYLEMPFGYIQTNNLLPLPPVHEVVTRWLGRNLRIVVIGDAEVHQFTDTELQLRIGPIFELALAFLAGAAKDAADEAAIDAICSQLF